MASVTREINHVTLSIALTAPIATTVANPSFGVLTAAAASPATTTTSTSISLLSLISFLVNDKSANPIGPFFTGDVQSRRDRSSSGGDGGGAISLRRPTPSPQPHFAAPHSHPETGRSFTVYHSISLGLSSTSFTHGSRCSSRRCFYLRHPSAPIPTKSPKSPKPTTNHISNPDFSPSLFHRCRQPDLCRPRQIRRWTSSILWSLLLFRLH